MIFDKNTNDVNSLNKDISEEKQLQRIWQESEQRYKSLFEQHPDAVFHFDIDGKFKDCNPSLGRLLGYTKEELLNSSFNHLVHKDYLEKTWDHFSKALKGEAQYYDIVAVHKDGHLMDVNVTNLPVVVNHQIVWVYGIAKDITDKRRLEELNKYFAYHDSLTGLPNRRLFEERLEQSLVIAKTLNHKLAVIYLDMDRFKYVNDSLGHSMGDKLLKQISQRITECTYENTFVARMCGDEFAILLPNITGTDCTIQVAKNIIESLARCFEIEEYELFISTSIGISIYPTDGQDSETLLKNADSALYRAKEQGKNNYQIYTPSMNIHSYKLHSLEKDLRKAIQNNQLELYYQPKVEPNSGQIVGAEALIRWNHPDWGIVSPNDFIPIAEETGLIAPISEWVKRTVCYQNKAWQHAGYPSIPISINMSARRFMHKGIIDTLRNVLNETQLEPHFLEIEILESSLLENEDIVSSTINELKEIGVKIALDDFGTGYTSLSYLKRFKQKIDTLKIDRSFLQDLGKDSDDKEIVKTIIKLAHHLKMTIVAEGVEDVNQLNFLRKQKCNEIQGYLFSKPVPTEEFAKLLKIGKLEPINSVDGQPNTVIQNQRRYFRINLYFPISASMTIIRIKGKNLQLGKTEVLIEDLGLGGLRFLSSLKMSVHPEIILEFETEILGEIIKFYGMIVWLRELQEGIFQYGLEFTIHENELAPMARLMNKFALQLKKSPFLPNCSFVKIDKYNYIKNITSND